MDLREFLKNMGVVMTMKNGMTRRAEENHLKIGSSIGLQIALLLSMQVVFTLVIIDIGVDQQQKQMEIDQYIFVSSDGVKQVKEYVSFRKDNGWMASGWWKYDAKPEDAEWIKNMLYKLRKEVK